MNDRVVAGILGAGRAERFGGHKLSADLAGKPLVQHMLDRCAALEWPTALVLSASNSGLAGLLSSGQHHIVNEASDDGMGTSVRCVADWALGLQAKVLVLLLADMPMVSSSLLVALAKVAADGFPAACRYPDGSLGVPAVFPSRQFSDLSGADASRGAKHLLATSEEVVSLTPEPHELFDIDTIHDLETARRKIEVLRGDDP